MITASLHRTGMVVVAVAAFGAAGCATKSFVTEQVGEASRSNDAKIGEVQRMVETSQMDVASLKKSDSDQNTQIGRLSDSAREALARAQEAGKLAKGKLLYEVSLSDDSVRFPFDSAKLSPEAHQVLDSLAARLASENQNIYIEIQGHTDATGPEHYNLRLGEERAEAVLRYLSMEKGIPLHRINVISYGPSKPVADNKTREGRAQNRRVTLVVLV